MPSGMAAATTPCTNNASVSCVFSGDTVIASLPAFTGNGEVQFFLNAIAPSTPGSYTTTATVRSSTPESDLSNNSHQATINVQ